MPKRAITKGNEKNTQDPCSAQYIEYQCFKNFYQNNNCRLQRRYNNLKNNPL